VYGAPRDAILLTIDWGATGVRVPSFENERRGDEVAVFRLNTSFACVAPVSSRIASSVWWIKSGRDVESSILKTHFRI